MFRHSQKISEWFLDAVKNDRTQVMCAALGSAGRDFFFLRTAPFIKYEFGSTTGAAGMS